MSESFSYLFFFLFASAPSVLWNFHLCREATFAFCLKVLLPFSGRRLEEVCEQWAAKSKSLIQKRKAKLLTILWLHDFEASKKLQPRRRSVPATSTRRPCRDERRRGNILKWMSKIIHSGKIKKSAVQCLIWACSKGKCTRLLMTKGSDFTHIEIEALVFIASGLLLEIKYNRKNND